MNNTCNPLKQYQQLLFWIETAGLLHDVGKLSSAFLKYRRTWQTQGGEDPHEQDFLGTKGSPTDPVLCDEGLQEIQKLFNTTFDTLCEIDTDVTSKDSKISINQSIASLLAFHVDPGKMELATMLNAADSKDAEQDRNNALLANEQDQTGDLFQATVFGKEQPVSGDLDQIRADLYKTLQETLCTAEKGITGKLREEVHQAVLQAFQQTVSDTCRPVNDITLWEHCYATATLFKVLFAHFLLTGEKIVSFPDVRFSLWGVGWDALAFYGTGHKIRDIAGRKKKIRKVKKEIRNIVEWEHCLGNTIYDDDNCLVFILPEIKGQEVEWFGGLKQHILETFHNETQDEFSMVFSAPKNTSLMVPVVSIIDEIRKKAAIPWQTDRIGKESLQWIDAWKGKDGNIICPVCRKRPMERSRVICDGCERIRKDSSTDEEISSGSLQAQETIYHDEIAQGNDGNSNRLALIVARFDLDRWLNGRYLYTQFVKDAVSMDKALEVLHSKKITGHPTIVQADDERRRVLNDTSISFTYKKIKALVEQCKSSNPTDEHAKARLFLLDRHFIEWDSIKLPPDWSSIDTVISDLKEMDFTVSLENYLVTKNHSPSRLLRIWNTTRNFYREQAENFRRLCLRKEGRLCLTVDLNGPLPPCGNSILTGTITPAGASVPAETIEAVHYQRGKFFVISRPISSEISWKHAEMILTKDEDSKPEISYALTVTGTHHEDIVSARTITVSPDLFLAVVPADKAMACCGQINDAYQYDFGKVYGTLPMGLGVLFFNRQMPMFVVLDGARRMINNFRSLAKEPVSATLKECSRKDTQHRFLLRVGQAEREKLLHVELSSSLGGGNRPDRFHPYIIVGKGVDGALLADRKSYFPTAAGNVLHFEDLKKGDEIRFHPNYFDFEYLDSTTRRFDLSLQTNKFRNAGAFKISARPYFLEELAQSIEKIWDILKKQGQKGMTDTKLRNLFALFLQWQAWGSEAGGSRVHDAFVQTAMQKEIKGLEPADLDLFGSLVENGIFFDVLELYLEILKERMGNSQGKKETI